MADPATSELLDQYAQTLNGKAAGTIEAYLRALRNLTNWISPLPDSFQFTQPALKKPTWLSCNKLATVPAIKRWLQWQPVALPVG